MESRQNIHVIYLYFSLELQIVQIDLHEHELGEGETHERDPSVMHI